jgi:putative peptide zinc metalloprotease protein
MDRLLMTTSAALQALLAQAQPQAQSKPLPKLREDLVVSQGPDSSLGQPTWLIYDPLRHRFVDIDQPTFEILSLWRYHATLESLAAAVAARTQRPSDMKELEQLVTFFTSSSLTLEGPNADWRHLNKLASKRAHGLLMTLVHNYLFFKIPIASPQHFLEATYPWVAPLFNRSIQLIIGLIGLIGLYLVARQWDEFISETRGLASVGGIAAFGAVLFIVKAFHELGHGYCAIRHKCRVPSMGLAFMMMAPLLYTDVTDAWRLKDRRKRLAIDAAGVCVELGFACLATFLWVFMPDGIVRHIVFLIATTSWVMSIAINLNPFMRFDGYYMFSDLLGVPNLQPRAFGLGVWQVREILFRLRAPCPEILTARLKAILIVYAWSVWIYRFFLFIGIAALVYTYFFKLLGIVLFAFEIGYFVIKPILKELNNWWAMRKAITKSSRSYVTLAAAVVAMAFVVIPWSTRVTVPALLDAGPLARVYPPRAARVKAVFVKPGDRVEKGQVLVQLEQPDLDYEKATTTSKRDTIKLRLDRQTADRDDLDDKLVLESALLSLSSKLTGLSLEQNELSVRAPQSGLIAELNPMLNLGRWISVKDQIALLTGFEAPKVKGYLPEDALWRIENGSVGIFVPEVPSASTVSVTITSVGAGSTGVIEIPELASSHGGKIEVQADARQRLIPSTAQYAVTMTSQGTALPPNTSVRGVVILQGHAESLIAGVYRRALKVLMRESGA